MKYCILIFVTFCFVGCKARDITVGPGEAKKIFSSSGIYADVFVDPEVQEKSKVTVSAEGADASQLVGYFDEAELEKVMIIGKVGSMIMKFEDESLEPEKIWIGVMFSDGDVISKKRYELVPIEDL